jgi:Cu+-exporting ATPase
MAYNCCLIILLRALMRDDWTLVPDALRVSRRARCTIRQNLGFTALYNGIGLTLAAIGVLPPVWAAAAQSLPDVAIMLNSARLLRQKRPPTARAHEPNVQTVQRSLS